MSRKKLLFGFLIFVIILKATQLTLISDYQTDLLKEISVSSVRVEQNIKDMQLSTAQASYEPMVEREPYTYTNTTICSYVGSTKSYMDGKAITDKNSMQYKLLADDSIQINAQGHYSYYDESTGVDFLGIALSSLYGNVGDRFKITTSDGHIIYGIKMDEKADEQVDKCGVHPDGSLIEFVVDEYSILNNGYYDGFTGGFQKYEGFQGSIVSIERKEE